MKASNKLFISNQRISVRLFESDFLEFFTYFHFSTPLVIFTPVLLYQAYKMLFVIMIPPLTMLYGVLVGLFIWSFAEYMTHRFLFHAKSTSKRGRRFIFLFHGVHHDYPRDSKRLVMTPFASVPIAISAFYLSVWVFNAHYAIPIFCGFVAGYVLYDTCHYVLHHCNFNNKNRILKRLQKYHLKHHYSEPDKGFGVTTRLWDYVFRTHFSI